ncbi:MAG: peptidase C45, partial [Planctomycetes bacterium]|nr:peptidase C45 [Planctomycetota bacterium]
MVVLEGSAYERGKMHGEKLKDEISELVKIWKLNIRETYNVEPDEFIADFVERTDYQPAIEEYTPELLEEVRGIAEGC